MLPNVSFTGEVISDADSSSSFEKHAKQDEQEKRELPPVGFFSLFRYSSCLDKTLIAIGTLAAILTGASIPGVNIIYGQFIDKLIIYDIFNKNLTNETIPTDEFLQSTGELCAITAAFGVASMLCNYIMVTFFSLAAANQAFRIKSLFMASILKQDIGWYDTTETGDFASRITGDLSRIQDGLGEKVCICISLASTILIIVVTSLLNSWKLTLVALCYTPVTSFAMAFMSKIQASVSREEMQAYGTAGAVAEEVLSAIRTVVSYGGENSEIERYNKCLVPAYKKGIKRGFITAVSSSITWVCSKLGFSLAFWYGIKLIVDGNLTGGRLVTVMFNVDTASMFLGQFAPHFEAFAMAKGAAAKIYNIIERILKGVSLDIQPGERVALVGPSGCGKSTIIQLIQRFYDPSQGAVLLDEDYVKDLNVGWLRDQIGLVGQEPVLFSMTIAENIKYGKKDATQEEIEQAAKTANIHNFIDALPLKYSTVVGERGTQLSGGQKQRIAIARALVKNPKILLLDEATSALDTESEAVVQAALDEASQGRTTVTVAHRLSTIRTADRIVFLSQGNVKEVGTHDELMEKEGIYFNLVKTQTKSPEEKTNKELDDNFVPELGLKMSTLSKTSVGSQTRLLGSVNSQSYMSAAEDEFKENDGELDENASQSRARLWKLSLSEWPYVLSGGIAAVLMGLLFMVHPVLLGSVLGVLSGDPKELKKETYVYCLTFVVVSVVSALFVFLQAFMFTVAGENITSMLRKMIFSNLIAQDIEFFDHPRNSVGCLCTRLTYDAASVQGATGYMISTLFQATTTLVAAIGLAFYFQYKIGLVVLAFVPCIWLGAYFGNRKVKEQETSDNLGTEEASKVAIEAIESIRTVASLHQEETIYRKFRNHLLGPYEKSKKQSHVRGIEYGLAQGFFTGISVAVIMFYGSRLIANKELSYADLLKITESVMMSAMVIRLAVAFAPEYQKAKVAAGRIFQLLDKKPKIDAFSKSGKRLEYVNGHIQFKKVAFTYSSRPSVKILNGLNLNIEPGKTVALVGSSGCGKSTCAQLIERFYEPQSGSVLLDDTDVGEMNVSNLRSHVGLVSQEPVLFSYSIAENIAYGDNSRQVGMHEIIEAARKANIHNFISELPLGYDTLVGDKGVQLSGGLPSICGIVQEALDKARSDRTCLIIAHRLTAVQNADAIMVIREGSIVEAGTHEELLNKKGHYYSMHNTQGS
ncbi:hypothetical protein JTE90_024080 [Oedothorax gibbosus]|uniref:ABC-type xenobiotic transporter n=1 Tax=Oedothorax gibbosus TaxID=931172 RepID=A0AAV6TZN8_9ARAC|nr:hypothetical protein JTE90_024080 [Oedothorax gibbosus]